jgi:hypothetical protein
MGFAFREGGHPAIADPADASLDERIRKVLSLSLFAA